MVGFGSLHSVSKRFGVAYSGQGKAEFLLRTMKLF